MSLRLHHVTVDCADALRVATFWAAALDKLLDEGGSSEFASVNASASEDQGWLFFQVPEPKSAKNRMHTDLRSDDRAGDVERLVALGATIVAEHDEWGSQWTVLQDVEGNEFCVIEVASA